MSFLDRHEGFVASLRRAGLPVSVAEDLDAVTAIETIDLVDRDQLRAAYAATLVKRQSQRASFDTLFDLFFPARIGDTAAPPSSDATRGERRRDDPQLQRYRDRLADALLDADERRLARLAVEGVARFGGVPGRRPGTGTWSSHAAQSRISPQTLVSRLLESLLGGADHSGLAERTARVTVDARIARFRSMIDTEVRRRLAEDVGPDEVVRTAVRPGIDRVDLLSATSADLAAIRREVTPLARRLAARLANDRRRGRRGPLDFRRTFRASLSTGGIPVDTVQRPRRPHKSDLVVLCDVSESVAAFARFTLLLVHAMREQFTRIRVFAFVDDLAEVTDAFRPGSDVVDSVSRLGTAAVRGWYGRTDYGRVFGLFHERHLDALTARSTLLVLGDARSNYGDPALPALRAMTGRVRRAYWLNPERRSAWDTGDSVASRMGDVVAMVECRNLAQLGEFVRDVASGALPQRG